MLDLVHMPIKDYEWTSTDGITRRPARGEMTHRHILNTMAFLLRNGNTYDSIISSTRGLAFRAGLRRQSISTYEPGPHSRQEEASHRYVFGENIQNVVQRGIHKYERA